jgi:hypothetical protein
MSGILPVAMHGKPTKTTYSYVVVSYVLYPENVSNYFQSSKWHLLKPKIEARAE